ncbi:hypothetical protein [Sphingosinicella sp. CPCC 101087]|uniref:hypothetical protein n=1 Tax=Sphingosinicella sp. CPCC 101087 TaxID=2497754 RepID=UPI00101B8F8C|nr:hypothetical protein [Sphingosinicella sp. CPCC 101087]
MEGGSLKNGLKHLVAWGVPALLALILGLSAGRPGIVAALLASLVWLAWRFDNQSGTFLVLTILVLIALAIPAMLLVLMAVTH